MTLDLTYNTDFAQVEVDDQQINLDRFSLFFPEKRPFFLENAGAFTVSNRGGGFNTEDDKPDRGRDQSPIAVLVIPRITRPRIVPRPTRFDSGSTWRSRGMGASHVGNSGRSR